MASFAVLSKKVQSRCSIASACNAGRPCTQLRQSCSRNIVGALCGSSLQDTEWCGIMIRAGLVKLMCSISDMVRKILKLSQSNLLASVVSWSLATGIGESKYNISFLIPALIISVVQWIIERR